MQVTFVVANGRILRDNFAEDAIVR